MKVKKSYRPFLMFVFALAGFVCCFHVSSAEVRTWTSTNGTTMEAELVRVEIGRVVLRTPGGKEVAIGLSALSAGDQAYLKKTTAGITNVAKAVASASPLAPERKTNAPVKASFSYKEANPLAGGLPDSIKLRRPDDAKFMLVQYGPEPGEVLYVVFDPPGAQVAADAAYVWSPSLIGFQTPRRITGKSRKMEDSNAYVFEIPVTMKFGEHGMKGAIELISGVQQWWLYFVVGNFDMVRQGQPSSFLVTGFLKEMAVGIADAQSAKPLRLFADIALHVYSHPETGSTTTDLKMGEYSLIPGKNMNNEIKVVIMDEEGSKAEERKMKINKDNMLSTAMVFNPDKLKSGQKYKTVATIDLGPIFGQQSRETVFTMK
jgi:hypothetical protein